MTSRCEICAGTGFEIVERDGRTAARPCGCQRERRSRRLLADARIPERYRNCSLDSYKTYGREPLEHALGVARQFVDEYPLERGTGLLLLGPCGVGKTHLAVSILRELVENKGVRGLFYDFLDLLREIQASFGPGSGISQSSVLRPVFQAEVLILDDLGSQRPTDWVRETVEYILKSRYNDERVTILTSNLKDDADDRSSERADASGGGAERDRSAGSVRTIEPTLTDRLGAPIRSRLHQMCRLVPVQGDDFRRFVHGDEVDRQRRRGPKSAQRIRLRRRPPSA